MVSQPTYEGRSITHSAMFRLNANTALPSAGMGLCLDRDRGTAANADAKRDHYSELPSKTNANRFLGIAREKLDAKAQDWDVEVMLPGSDCRIAILMETTLNVTRLTCHVDDGVAGFFGKAGLCPGRGSALALQTVAAVASDSTDLVGPVSHSLDGSATYTTSSRTLTSTGSFTNAAAGDFVYIVGGMDTAGSATELTLGKYVIESVTSANAVVLTTAPGSADSEGVHFYCVRGYPTCQARLEDGPESGLVEFITPGTGAIAQTIGAFGTTFICGLNGEALNTNDSTYTLADGTYTLQNKAFQLTSALATNDFVITVTTGVQVTGAALASLEFDGAGDSWCGCWTGETWATDHIAGTTAA